MRHGTRRNIPCHGFRNLPRQEHADLVIRMSRKKLPQVFTGIANFFEISQQALDCVWHFRRGAAIPYRTGNRGKFAHRATDAEVIRVHHLAAHFDFLAFQADVRDPMLAAAIRASGNVQLQLLVESRNAVLEFFHQPARKALRLGQRQFAEFGARASDGPARER